MADQILPLDEHVKILLNGEMHQHPCDDIQENQILQDIPPWFDKEKFKRGQKYIMHNYMGQFAVAVSGLICVLAVPSILKILIKTQKSSTVESAYRRYVSTSFHVHSWYSDAFQPGSTSWKSLLAVRKRHLRASKGSLSKGGGHISQRDLVFTQFGFFGLGLLRAQWLGMATTDIQDLEGYLHFWRTIGYMIGIEDRYNICRPSVEETKHISQIICEEVYQKLLYNPPEHFYHMAKEMLEGLWYVDTSLSTKCYLYFTYWLVGVKGFTGPNGITLNALEEGENKNKYFTNGLLQSESSQDNILNADKLYSAFSWLEKFKMYLIFIIYGKWLYSYIGRLYYNTSSLLTVYLTMYIPYTGFWRFGIKRSYVNMFKEDISIEGEVKTNKDVLAELYT